MSQNATELRLKDLSEVKPHLTTKLKNAGIMSLFDLAISIPHQLHIPNSPVLQIQDDTNIRRNHRFHGYFDSPFFIYSLVIGVFN